MKHKITTTIQETKCNRKLHHSADRASNKRRLCKIAEQNKQNFNYIESVSDNEIN